MLSDLLKKVENIDLKLGTLPSQVNSTTQEAYAKSNGADRTT